MNFLRNFLLKRKLKKINPNTIPFFSFNGLKVYALIYDIYDGDTCKIIFKYEKKFIKYRVRLYGIDTPELRTHDDNEKKRGYEAKAFLENIVKKHNKIMKVELLKFDKYGRLLCKIYTKKNENVTDLLISNGHGYAYFGGTKNT